MSNSDRSSKTPDSDSDKKQEFSDEDITESDISMVDQSVALKTAINFQVTQEDSDTIDVDVAVAEAARFPVTKGDLTRIDQIPTEEQRAKIAMSVELADEQHIDPCDNLEDEQRAWAEDLIESHDVYLRNSEQQIVDQHRHQNRDHHTDDEQNGDQQNREQKNDDQQNKDKTR